MDVGKADGVQGGSGPPVPACGRTSLRVYLPTGVPHGVYDGRRNASGNHMNIVSRLWRQTKVCGISAGPP